MKPTSLVTSAVLGILAGAACGGTQPAASTPATTIQSSGGKDGCGNHPPGQCAAADTAKAAAPPNESTGPLAIVRTETIAPGAHVEINLTFTDVTTAKATFKASGALVWNVHSHPHGDVVVHQKGNGANGEIAFQPPAAGPYSFLWTNDGTSPVTLDLKVTGDHGVREHQH